MKLKARLMMPIQKANEEENMGDIAQFESEGFIFVAELKNCQNEQLDPNKEYEVDVMFYGHQLDGIYGTAEEFHKSNAPMAEESGYLCIQLLVALIAALPNRLSVGGSVSVGHTSATIQL